MPLSPLRGSRKRSICCIVLAFSAAPVADVGAVEAGDEAVVGADIQMLDDFGPRRRVRRGCQCDARHAREEVHKTIKSAVFGPEIMAPLRKAVRLVDGDQ